MDENENDAEQRFIKLINELSPANSNLAIRCREDARFRRQAALMIDALDGFYRRINTDALQKFEREKKEWVKNPPTSYIGFFGELRVADQLRKWGVHHQFMREVKGSSTPDLELTVMKRKVYLEVKTLQPNLKEQFYKRVQNEVDKLNLYYSKFTIREIDVKNEMLNALVDIAVRMIEEAAHKDRNPRIKYNEKEGNFYIYIKFETKVCHKPLQMITAWPDTRKRADNTPWAQSVLEETLRNHINQFRSYTPTFLAWVNLDVLSFDLESHATQVIERFGQTEFVDVVGITIFDLNGGYCLVENQCRKYSTVEYTGLFDVIRNLSISKI